MTEFIRELKRALLETKCGCVIMRDSKEHDECRCDDNGENWICAGCYNGEYDEKEDNFPSNQLCRHCEEKPILRGESLCRDCFLNNDEEEETIYEKVLRKCEQCDSEDKEKLAEYWWNETANKKWTLCEDCGIAEEQDKCDEEDEE